MVLLTVGAVVVVMLYGAERAEATPIVTFKCTPAPLNCSGWYRSNVSIDWEVSPSDASVLGGCQDKTFTADTPAVGTNELCKVDDGEATVTVELKIRVDKTAPVVVGGQPARGADVNGWYNHPVAVVFSGSDLTSGIESCTSPTYSGPDSGAASLSGTCIDRAGNVSSPFGYGLNYDETAPSVTGANPDRPPSTSGWFNGPVEFDFVGTDATSGIGACTTTMYTGPQSAAGSFSGSCTDRAGNLTRRTFPIQYDTTAPTATGGQAKREPDKDGWYNHAVEVGFNGTDSLSGVASCTTPTFRGPDGSAQPVPGTCTDRAGNVSDPVSVVLRYDGTAPLVTGGSPARTPDANGWYNHPVAVAFSGSDETSGLAGCSTATYAGPDSATASLPGTCTDVAGNTSAPAGHSLQYDATAPEIARAIAERDPDADGWYNRPVNFAIEGRDATSGIQTCPAVTYSGPNGPASSFLGQCTDRAGNLASRAFGLKFDASLPSPATKQVARRRRLHLVAPAAGAVIKAGRRPLLRWTPVPGASYYNVQLFRDGKILTVWTTQPQYRLKLRWRHGGRRYRLRPGEYHWIVWPGFGLRSKADYGRRIGRRGFQVAAAGR